MLLYAGPKHFDKIKPEPGPTRKARPDLQLWSGLHTTQAQITRITSKWIYTEYTVLKIFSPFRIFE